MTKLKEMNTEKLYQYSVNFLRSIGDYSFLSASRKFKFLKYHDEIKYPIAVCEDLHTGKIININVNNLWEEGKWEPN